MSLIKSAPSRRAIQMFRKCNKVIVEVLMPKRRKCLWLLALGLLCVSCSVKRPPLAPHRSDTNEHRQAKTIAQCLACHADNMPHAKDRGDCLKCHRISQGG